MQSQSAADQAPLHGASIPILCPDIEAPVEVSMLAWRTLALIDGRMSVAQIASVLGCDSREIQALLGDLAALGLVTFDPAVLARRSAAPRPYGFFERLIVHAS